MASAPMTLPSPAATPALSLRLVVDSASRRVLFAEAGRDAVAFLSALLATPVRAAVEMLLQEDPPSATAGSFGNFSAAGALQPPRGAASTSSSSMTAPAASPASASQARPPPGMGIISAMRLYRCDHLRCRCSDVVSRSGGSACRCVSCGAGGTRGTELHFLEAVFYRRADGSAVCEEVVPFGYKQGLSMLWASLQTKTVLTDVFLRTAAGDAPRRRRRC